MTQNQTAKAPTTRALTHVIAATDFSELGDRAVLSALRLAKVQPKSELHVIAVAFGEGNGLRMPWGDTSQLYSQAEAEQQMKERIANLIAPEAEAASGHVESINVYLSIGNPAEQIVRLAQTVDAELVVVGTHGRTGFARLVLGSVAEAVVRNAPCAVLVIRPRDFLGGLPVPHVEPPLKEGQHSLRPFHRSLIHHYVDRGAAASARVLPAG
ncbi:MAG TPA: universal stress protein [Polyangiaceae bacterium]|jgi:nucleotide-binding universal stress UspA family protein|nr:universal stress protein [Polyangiaceae bacterium]